VGKGRAPLARACATADELTAATGTKCSSRNPSERALALIALGASAVGLSEWSLLQLLANQRRFVRPTFRSGSRVRRTIGQLAKEGLIEQDGNRRWRLSRSLMEDIHAKRA